MFFILFFLFLFLQNQRTGGQSKSCSRGRTGTSRRGGDFGKRGRRVNTVQKCVYMYVNTKMIPFKTTPSVGVRG
jgi:hypothetical protein